MEIQDINAFLTIAKTKNITHAARILHITQPALTQKINLLEKELGYSLLERKRGVRFVELTYNGTAFFEFASKILDNWNHALKVANTKFKDKLQISGVESINLFILAKVLRQFSNMHPDCQISVKNQYSGEIYNAVEDGITDLGIINNLQYSKNIDCIPIFSEKMFFVCYKEAKYKPPINITQLNPEECIFETWSTDFEMWYQYYFSSNQNCLFQLQSTIMLQDFFEIHDSWSIVPATVAYWLQKQADINVMDMINGPKDRTTYLIFKRNSLSDTTKNLITLLKNYASTIKGVNLFT